MNNLLIAPQLVQSIIQWAQPQFFAFLTASPLALKVYELAKQHFSLLQYICVFSFRAKELSYDRVNIIKKQDQEFYFVHGLFFISSGVVGIVAALANSRFLFDVGGGLFTCGNVAALLYYSEILHDSADPVARRSAALGLFSSIGYILATACYVLGTSEMLALFIGCLALVCGGMKILYDAYHILQNFLK